VAKEFDPVEDVLIQQAASDCLLVLRQLSESGEVTIFVVSGNDTLRVRVSLVSDMDIRVNQSPMSGND
jgi:hypothetical protein